MHKLLFKISFLAIATVCLLWGPVGCGGDEETAPAKPAVVAKKIASAPKPLKAKKPAVPARGGATPAAVKQPAGAAAPESVPAASAKEGEDVAVQKTMANIEKDAVTGAATIYRARLYKPEGKLDPFEVPFKKKANERNVEEKQEAEAPKRIRQTPLERIALSQLKLVGVIKFSSGYQAIVEEQSGKGYMIKKGTYVGTNYGQVTEIHNDRIIIQEQVKDLVLGKYKEQKSQLKLQKPLGEN